MKPKQEKAPKPSKDKNVPPEQPPEQPSDVERENGMRGNTGIEREDRADGPIE